MHHAGVKMQFSYNYLSANRFLDVVYYSLWQSYTIDPWVKDIHQWAVGQYGGGVGGIIRSLVLSDLLDLSQCQTQPEQTSPATLLQQV